MNTDYIKTNKEQLLAGLKDNLDAERYEHSLGVAEYAQRLAKKYDLDKDKAYLAGLLHDCAKCFPTEILLAQIEENNLTLEPGEKCNKKTLHAPVSALVARKDFGVEDEEILSAIRWHTLGKINMTDFEKIIFVADKVEERTREHEIAQPVRNLLEEENGLNKAVLLCYKQTIKSLVDRDLKICLQTVEIYNHLQDSINIK